MKSNSDFTRRKFVARSAVALTGTAIGFGAVAAEAVTAQSAAGSTASQTPPPEVTRILAKWVIETKSEDVPDVARTEATRTILNWVGVALGGSREPAVASAIAALEPYSHGGKAHLFGRSERFDPLRAALINGISSHVFDYDDTHLQTLIHPAGSVAAALFALAEDHPLSGAEFIHAFIVGTEVECRLGSAIYPSHYDMGWHITGTCGVFGAVAACGKVLGLDEERMCSALGLAATQASGLKIMFGTMAKSFHVGHAAEDGLLAALLASKGFTASDRAIEGKEGYVYAASTHHDYAPITQNLGKPYLISQNTYKPFPCGIVLHAPLDGMIQLHDEKHPNPAEVDSITIRGNPLVLQLTGKKTPATGLEGKFSIYHAAAISLITGQAGVKEFSDEAVARRDVIELRDRVHVETDSSVRADESYVTVRMDNGSVYSKHVEYALGSLQKPMSDKQLENKFQKLAEGVLPQLQIVTLLQQLWALQDLKDAATISIVGGLRNG